MDEKQEAKLLKFLKKNNVSDHNQEIVFRYLKSIERIGRAQTTVDNNEMFMKFLVTHTKTDLDKLTAVDVEDIQDEINGWIKQTGEPANDSSKLLYKRSLKRFLKKFGKIIKNQEMIEAADFELAVVKSKRLKPEDILTEDDIDKIANATTKLRDEALIRLIYESGARVGEIENCKLKHIHDHPFGFHITLIGKTGERQVVIYKCQQRLRQWLDNHPDRNNPEAPLFTTTRQYSINSYSVDLEERKKAKTEPHEYRVLTQKSILDIVKVAAKKAGIDNKRIYTHLLRHSQVTRLANSLTEQQLKVQFGWHPSSPMVGHYSHITGQDVDNAVLGSYGVVIKRDKDGTKVERCARCNKPVTVGLKFCECGMPLTEEGMKSYNRVMSDNDFIAKLIQVNRELDQIMNDDDEDDPKLKMVRENNDW